jgi:transposase
MSIVLEANMCGEEEAQGELLIYGYPEERIPADHPLRAIRRICDLALREVSPLLSSLYAQGGRHSIPPEYLLRAQLLQILYAIPSERKLCKHLDDNLLFRWFVGLRMSDPVWHPTTFTQNRDRLLTSEVAERFFFEIRGQAEAKKLLSREHFTVDGALIEAAASVESFRAKDEGSDTRDDDGHGPGRNPEVNFHGERAAIRPTPLAPIPTLVWPARRAKEPSSPVPGICFLRTGTVSSWMWNSRL